MLQRIFELLKPVIDGDDVNYESTDQLPVDNSNAEGDEDASNPQRKGE